MPSLSANKRAHYDYQILETFEAGLVLTGAEAKSAKSGQMGLKSAYAALKFNAQTKRPELFLINAHIPPYQKANTTKDYDPERSRKLLLHQREIQSLIGRMKQKGLTLLALKAYTKRGKIKLELGLGKGKKQIDKRETIKKREQEREIKKVLKYK